MNRIGRGVNDASQMGLQTRVLPPTCPDRIPGDADSLPQPVLLSPALRGVTISSHLYPHPFVFSSPGLFPLVPTKIRWVLGEPSHSSFWEPEAWPRAMEQGGRGALKAVEQTVLVAGGGHPQQWEVSMATVEKQCFRCPWAS